MTPSQNPDTRVEHDRVAQCPECLIFWTVEARQPWISTCEECDGPTRDLTALPKLLSTLAADLEAEADNERAKGIIGDTRAHTRREAAERIRSLGDS